MKGHGALCLSFFVPLLVLLCQLVFAHGEPEVEPIAPGFTLSGTLEPGQWKYFSNNATKQTIPHRAFYVALSNLSVAADLYLAFNYQPNATHFDSNGTNNTPIEEAALSLDNTGTYFVSIYNPSNASTEYMLLLLYEEDRSTNMYTNNVDTVTYNNYWNFYHIPIRNDHAFALVITVAFDNATSNPRCLYDTEVAIRFNGYPSRLDIPATSHYYGVYDNLKYYLSPREDTMKGRLYVGVFNADNITCTYNLTIRGEGDIVLPLQVPFQNIALLNNWDFYRIIIPPTIEPSQVLLVEFTTDNCVTPIIVRIANNDTYPMYDDLARGVPRGFHLAYNSNLVTLVGRTQGGFKAGEVWRVSVFSNDTRTDIPYFNQCFYTIKANLVQSTTLHLGDKQDQLQIQPLGWYYINTIGTLLPHSLKNILHTEFQASVFDVYILFHNTSADPAGWDQNYPTVAHHDGDTTFCVEGCDISLSAFVNATIAFYNPLDRNDITFSADLREDSSAVPLDKKISTATVLIMVTSIVVGVITLMAVITAVVITQFCSKKGLVNTGFVLFDDDKDYN